MFYVTIKNQDNVILANRVQCYSSHENPKNIAFEVLQQVAKNYDISPDSLSFEISD